MRQRRLDWPARLKRLGCYNESKLMCSLAYLQSLSSSKDWLQRHLPWFLCHFGKHKQARHINGSWYPAELALRILHLCRTIYAHTNAWKNLRQPLSPSLILSCPLQNFIIRMCSSISSKWRYMPEARSSVWEEGVLAGFAGRLGIQSSVSFEECFVPLLWSPATVPSTKVWAKQCRHASQILL